MAACHLTGGTSLTEVAQCVACLLLGQGSELDCCLHLSEGLSSVLPHCQEHLLSQEEDVDSVGRMF